MINGKELSKVYAKTFGVSQRYAAEICGSVFELLGKLLYEEKEDITIYGFGSFKQKTMAEKRARHPGTGEMIVIPERHIVKFRSTESCEKD